MSDGAVRLTWGDVTRAARRLSGVMRARVRGLDSASRGLPGGGSWRARTSPCGGSPEAGRTSWLCCPRVRASSPSRTRPTPPWRWMT